KLPVNEIRHPAQEQSNRRDDAEIVAGIRPRKSTPARVDERKDDNANNPAVARHAALPNSQNGKRIAQHLRPVEKNVAEPAADHYAEERHPGDEITQRRLGQIEI